MAKATEHEKISLDGMSDEEVLTLLISQTRKYDDPNSIAKGLIKCYGSLYEVIHVRPKRLIAYNGLDEHTATFLTLFPPLTKAFYKSKNKNVRFLRKTEDIKRYVTNCLIAQYRECFLLICLNERYRILNCEIIAEGDCGETKINERKLAERLFTYDSKKAIIAHNHPRGSAKPSHPDIYATKSIQELLKMINVEFMDHIIVGRDGAISMLYDTDCLEPFKDD